MTTPIKEQTEQWIDHDLHAMQDVYGAIQYTVEDMRQDIYPKRELGKVPFTDVKEMFEWDVRLEDRLQELQQLIQTLEKYRLYIETLTQVYVRVDNN